MSNTIPRRPVRWLLSGLAAALLAAVLPVAAQGARLTGTMKGEDGKPLANIAFRLAAQDTEGGTIDNLTTDKKGRFTVPNLRAGTYRVELSTSGWRVARVELEARTPDGQRAAEFAEDVPPGILHTPFEANQAYRMEMSFVLVTVAAEEEPGQTRSLAAARGESEKLRELNALFENGQMAELATAAATVVQTNPELGGAWYLLAVGQWQTGRDEDAVASFRKALELVPDQPGVKGALGSALLDLGDGLRDKGDDAGARAAWEEAASLLGAQCAETPGDATFATNRVVALERLGRKEELIGAVEALMVSNPGDLRAYLRLAELYAETGNRAKALEILDSIPSPDHDAAVAMYNIAVEMYNDGDYDAMVLVLGKALAIEPEAPEYHRLLGRAYLSKGDNAKAIAELKEFLRLAPDDPGAEVEQALVEALEKK